MRIDETQREQIRKELDKGSDIPADVVRALLADHEELASAPTDCRELEAARRRIEIATHTLTAEMNRRRVAEDIIRRIALGEITARYELGVADLEADRIVIEAVPRYEIVMGRGEVPAHG
jgi:hypothetical protein